VQAGAFSARERADEFRDSLREEFPDASVIQAGEIWRVLLGHGLPLDQANRLAEAAKASGHEVLLSKD
ncbi:MAG: SPOR domain-containing protein, partial [Bryobacteraceae bacterium]